MVFALLFIPSVTAINDVPKIKQQSKPIVVSHWKKVAGKMTPYVIQAADKTGVSPKLITAMIVVESHGHPEAVSNAGAIGPMQLMPYTAWNVLRVNPWNPEQNIMGGARYIQRLIKRYHGNRKLALAAYNAGPTMVDEDGGVPICAKQYVKEVFKIEKSI